MSNDEETITINQGVVLLFILMVILTGGLIVEHSRLAIIPLLIGALSGMYVLYKINQRSKCNCKHE